MEHAAFAPWTTVRRRKGRPPLASYGASAPEKADRSPSDADQGTKAAGSKEEMSMIDAIKGNGKHIHRAVKKWVERYETDSKSAIVEIIMLLFEVCGSKYQLEIDSFDDTEVDDVVHSLVELAKNGEVEDYFNTEKKGPRNFRENVASLWDKLVLECQHGPLFDKILSEKCMDYVIAMSCTPPRVYRQMASLVGLQLVTSFITVAKVLSGQRETTQRQLNAEKKKENDGPHLESLKKRLSLTHEKITAIEEMMRKLFTGLFMNRFRDVDPEIRMSCIKSLGSWILSYPSLFLKDLYLKYLGWALNDKSSGVRKASILALQSLYEVDDNVPSLGLFTERFCNRMIELADDIDISAAVSAIGLLKRLLRHQLLTDDELGHLYDLLFDKSPLIRRAIGVLVFDHLIVQKLKDSHSEQKDGKEESSEVHLGCMLHILREFPDDPILNAYVIDNVWDDMMAMKDWKCIISMLLHEHPHIELTDVDATNLVRLLNASARKAVGEKIVPDTDNRKQYYTKAQRDALETSRREITTAMMKSYAQLLQKYISDKAKISPLVEIMGLLKLELYSLKRQEQNFERTLELMVDAFFKHAEKDTLRSCIKVITFCSTDSQADLQDYAHNKLKDLENVLITKLRFAIEEVKMGGDEYTLMVNLKRLHELQLTKSVSINELYEDMASIIRDCTDIDNEVKCFLLLNMHLHVVWCLQSIDAESPEASLGALLSKRDALLELLDCLTRDLPNSPQEGRSRNVLSSNVCAILAEIWCLFVKSKYSSSQLKSLGYHPDIPSIKKFWKLSKMLLTVSDEIIDEDSNGERIGENLETSGVVVMIAAVRLVETHTVFKDYLAPEIISQFGMHGTSIAEIVKHLITSLRKTAFDEIPAIFVEALRRSYRRETRDDESSASMPFSECKNLASRLSTMYIGAARNKHKSEILLITKDGLEYAFSDAPRNLSFLEVAVLPFVSKLPKSDILEILKDVQNRFDNSNMDENPSGWRPYSAFVDHLQEKCSKNELQDEKEGIPVRRRGHPRKIRNVEDGKKLFERYESSDEDSIDVSEQNDQEDEEAD